MAQFPLIDQASLAMIPGAYKESKVYSQLPTDGSGDFTFSRGTDNATRVNEEGLIEKGYENLLLQSNTFSDAAWINSNSTETSGQSGYDGSSDAWLLTKDGNAEGYIKYESHSVSGVNTISIYTKENTSSWIYIFADTIGGYYFDLRPSTTGNRVGTEVLTGSIDGSAFVEDIGNDWFRVGFSWNGSNSRIRITPAEGDGQRTDTTGSIYIQDAQLNQGLVAYPYLETTASPAYGGITANQPRLDYTDSSCPALLLEPQRTNLVEHSEYQSSTIYGNQDVSIADNAAISPEGLQNAAKIILDSGTNTSNGGHSYPFASTANTDYTISVFAKAGEMRYFTFTYGSSAAGGGHFDLQEGTLLGTITNGQYSNESASIEDYGNGWYRLVVSLTDNSSVSGRYLSMKPSPSASVPTNNNYSSTGDGTSGAYIYGFQLEEGSYATSYIPTYGTSQTRNNDETNVAGLQSKNIITSSQGTMFFDIPYNEGTAVQFNMQSPNDLSYGLRFVVKVNGFTLYQRINNVQTIIRQRNDLSYTQWKIAMAWNGTNLISSINGISYVDTIDASLASQLDTLKRVNSTTIAVKVNQTLVFPTQLTEAELNDLTTL